MLGRSLAVLALCVLFAAPPGQDIPPPPLPPQDASAHG